jgi:transcriptional regulator with XRE-family HTH domain
MLVTVPDLHLGFIIRRIREWQGMSQSELARNSEANLSYISTVESNVNNISIKKMFLICNALCVPAGQVLDIQQDVVWSGYLLGWAVSAP